MLPLIRISFTVLVLLACFRCSGADEARAVIEDNVAHGRQEVVPPDNGATDDGPLVTPIQHGATPPGVLGGGSHDPHAKPPGRFQVAAVDFHHVSTPFIISLWIIIAGLAKIGFHVLPKISHICPESCLLIVVGVAIGLLLFYTGINHVGPLTPDVFFLYMLPPIVLDAGYFMPNRQFFNNLVSILMFAVVGTVWNAMTIGLSLWGVAQTGLFGVDLPLLHILLFSSIVSAVDPVAVLAVFEEIQVNEVLYILVFGESLLNDAVTVVLYKMFEGYTRMGGDIIPVDYVTGVASFFVVAVGGTLVGIFWGLIAAFISRFTHHVRVIEPLFVFIMAYLSYLSAELFHLSGILALTFCGITMKNYVEENISYKSHVTVKYAMKMMASSSETIIFMFLGVSTVNDQHEWNTWFVVLTIFFCTIYRAFGVILLSSLANRFRLHRFNKVDQFIIAYGGLRGAVAFALVLVISKNLIPTKDMMVTTVIAVVYFTVFIQGMTIGPLVRILNVPTSNKKKPSMNERIHIRLMDHLMAGIEDIAGQMMGNYHLRDKFKYYNNKYLRPFLTKDHTNREPKIFETYSKLNLADAMNLVKQNGNLVPVMGTENSISLSTLFRSYTQANFNRSFVGGSENSVNESGIPHNNSGFLNFDLGELEYCPSNRDLVDAELHHILSDAMFKPTKRHPRRYSRNYIFENKPHPPFHHQMRMQIRQMYSENGKPRRRGRSQHGQHGGSAANGYGPHKGSCKHRVQTAQYANARAQRNGDTGGHHATSLRFTLPGEQNCPSPTSTEAGVSLASSKENSPAHKLSPRDPAGDSSQQQASSLTSEIHEDEGIIFVARSTPGERQVGTSIAGGLFRMAQGLGSIADELEKRLINGRIPYYAGGATPEDGDDEDEEPTSPPASRTVTETTLPWKREENNDSSKSCVRQQSEFPSWIENKDYLAYISPTNTFLGKLGGSNRNLPPVFEIFGQKLSESQEDVFLETDEERSATTTTEESTSSPEKSPTKRLPPGAGPRRRSLEQMMTGRRSSPSHIHSFPSLVAVVARRLSLSSGSPPSDSTVVTMVEEDNSIHNGNVNLGADDNLSSTVIDLNERRKDNDSTS